MTQEEEGYTIDTWFLKGFLIGTLFGTILICLLSIIIFLTLS